AVWPRGRASGDRRESVAQAATRRATSGSPAGAKLDTERPPPVRVRGGFPQLRTHSKGFHRLPSFNTSCVSSGVCAWQIPPSVLVHALPEETPTARAERGSHPGHRRDQNAQSAVRLSTDRVDHLADVRHRHRQERRVPRAGDTLSPCSGGTGPFVVVIHWTHYRQPVEHRPVSLRVD